MIKEDENINGVVHSTKSKPNRQAHSTNEDRSTLKEQHTAQKVRQSFSWLVSSPIDSDTAATEEKDKGGNPVEGKAKSRNVVKYQNEKYLKSWQRSSELPKQKDDASSQSSSAANNQGKCAKNDDTGYKASKNEMELKERNVKQGHRVLRNREQVFKCGNSRPIWFNFSYTNFLPSNL